MPRMPQPSQPQQQQAQMNLPPSAMSLDELEKRLVDSPQKKSPPASSPLTATTQTSQPLPSFDDLRAMGLLPPATRTAPGAPQGHPTQVAPMPQQPPLPGLGLPPFGGLGLPGSAFGGLPFAAPPMGVTPPAGGSPIRPQPGEEPKPLVLNDFPQLNLLSQFGQQSNNGNNPLTQPPQQQQQSRPNANPNAALDPPDSSATLQCHWQP